MSNKPYSPKQAHFSREGFQPIASDMSRHDATIDIPLEQVPSNGGGLRHEDSSAPLRPTTDETANDTPPQEGGKGGFTRGHRKRYSAPGRPNHGRPKIGYDGEENTVHTMGRIYDKIKHFSIITRYFLYVWPLALMIAVPIIVGATAAKNARIGGVRIVWFFTWVEVVWLSLWGSKIVAHFLPKLFQMIVGVVSSGVRKYSLVLKSLEIPLSLVGWAVTSLATFMPLMTLNPSKRAAGNTDSEEWMRIVQKVLGAFVVASLILLGEKFIIQLISINYHRKQFASRIKDSKRNVYLLGQLYDASRNMFPAYCNEFAEEDYIISDQLNLSLALGSKGAKSHARSGTATPGRMLLDVQRYGDKITSVFGNVAAEVTGRQVFNPNSSHSVVIEALEKKRSAEALAKRIWMSFVSEGKEELLLDDVVDVLGSERRELAEECFWTLDTDGNGDVSLDEMILTVAEIKRERKAISTSMHDVDQAINVLDRLLCVVAFVAVIFVFVAFLNANFTTTLATTGTALLSLSFVFSATAQEVLGSCIFLFVKHPFDIGDRVDIGTNQFTVDHISLLYTVFRRVSGTGVGRSVQIPNLILNSQWVENVTRSKAMVEQLTIDVDFATTFDDIQILKRELLNFVTDKDNARDFQPSLEVEVLGTSDMSKLSLQVEIKHKSNWANESVRASRRSKFMCALVAALKAVPIAPPGGAADAAGTAANPNYSVTISDAEAQENMTKSATDKEKARLIPTKKDDEDDAPGSDGLSPHQGKVIDDLTTRADPGADPARDKAWTSSREGDDSSTLGPDRASLDRQDLEDVRGILRRQSTLGKRRPGDRLRYRLPNIPSIAEPADGSGGSNGGAPEAFADYAHFRRSSQVSQRSQSRGGSNNYGLRSPSNASNRVPPYASPYLSAAGGQGHGQAVEMTQVPPAATTTPTGRNSWNNPYRQPSVHSGLSLQRSRGESVSYQQSGGRPAGASFEEGDEEDGSGDGRGNGGRGDYRSYSGV
ncbi:hypothetical protein MBLNU230_g5356t1 [Neophaeotheca triangularis]